MDQIVKSLAEKLNLPESVVRSGIGILLNFIKKEAAGSQFEKFIAFLPGADDLMATAPAGGSSGGLLGGLLEKAGGLIGGNLGSATEAIGALQEAGIPLEKAAPLAGEFLEHAKQAASPDVVSELLEQIPALKSLLGNAK